MDTSNSNHKLKSLSIIFPVYKDSKTVENMISKSALLLSKYDFDSEIVVVNDSCPDGSGKIAENLKNKYQNLVVLHHEKNKGYGEALKTGFKACTKEWILQADGDDQYDINEIENMIKILHNYDCIITFRYKKIYNTFRIFVSWFYNKLVRFIFKTNFRDISTGLRLINRKALNDLNLISSSSFIGAEIAIALMLKGYQIGEMGIVTYPRKFGNGGVVTLKGIVLTIIDLIKVYKHLFKKK